MFRVFRYLSIFMLVPLIAGCYPLVKKQIKAPSDALQRQRYFWPEFQDDMDVQSLSLAIERSLEYLNRLDQGTVFTYGPDTFPVEHIRHSLETFSQIINEDYDVKRFNKELRRRFLVYRAAGSRGNRKVLFTGYFEPVLEGSLNRDSVFQYPIYEKPDDLLKIDLGLFRSEWNGQRLMGRIDGETVIPYHTRKDIAEGNVLEGENLEIAWLKDPLDSAILQIQGSGTIKLPTGDSIRVGYSAANGHPYRSIGRYLIDKGYIEPEHLSLQTIRSFLNDRPEIKDEILNYNPSFVFFRVLDTGPLGNINVALTPGRSLALDSRLFPKGGLTFVRCQMPIAGEDGTIVQWIPFSRFFLNQDTGGAIKGAGRADIFWGSGEYAELAAGHLKHEGEVYFLVLKPDSENDR
jgi:membrane-bound lytic murein transglycosylase A